MGYRQVVCHEDSFGVQKTMTRTEQIDIRVTFNRILDLIEELADIAGNSVYLEENIEVLRKSIDDRFSL